MDRTFSLEIKLNYCKPLKFIFLLIVLFCLPSCQNIQNEYKEQKINFDELKLEKLVDVFSEKEATIKTVDTSKVASDDIETECPDEGSAVSEKVRGLNVFKNRTKFPIENDFDKGITLSKMLQEGNDKSRWSNMKAARISGYVYDVKPGGAETCNCKTKEIDKRDTHIEIVLDPNNQGKSKRVIVEVTPRIRMIMKSKGLDWSTKHIRARYLGRFVEIEGWMLFDMEHANAAENTKPGRPRNWRATAWEIHPITSIKILDKNPNLFH